MNKKYLLFCVLALTLPILFIACVEAKSSNADSPPSEAPLYRVTKSTGLYDDPGMDADLIAELSVGTLLKPVNDAKFYDCESIVDLGTTYTLCFVEVMNTGKTGWVLQMWTERYEP
jgi:hypothetical protein